MGWTSIRSLLGLMWNPPTLSRFLLERALRSALKGRFAGKVLEVGVSTLYSRQKLMQFESYVTVDLNKIAKPSIVGDAHRLPLADKTFDTILIFEVLEHCPEPALVLNECRRVLVEMGHLFLSTRFLYPQHDAPYDYFRFTEESLRYLLRDWKSVSIVPLGNRWSTIFDLLSGKSRLLRWVFWPCGVWMKGSNVSAGGFLVFSQK
jgi:SAM-dependent methyltransferase